MHKKDGKDGEENSWRDNCAMNWISELSVHLSDSLRLSLRLKLSYLGLIQETF